MKKKFLNFMLLGAFAFALSSSFVACSSDDYDDDIKRLEELIDANKKKLDELSTTIASGQWVKSVDAISNGIKVTLGNGTAYEITNGKDGADGGSGAAGTVVKIGENGNWTLDGVDTGVPAKGQDGKDGEDGKDGASGSASVFTLGENGNLFVDGKDTGVHIGKEGITAVVTDGVLALFGVEGYKDGYKIALNSACLSSLQFVPEWIDNGVATQGFYYINRLAVPKDVVYNSEPDMTFRYNPTSANLNGIDWSFINRTAIVTRATDDKKDLLSIVGEPKIVNNALVFRVKGDATKRQETLSTGGNKEDIAYLDANAPTDPNKADGDKMDILSDYIKIRFEGVTPFIGDTVQMVKDNPKQPYPTYDYYTNLDLLKGTSTTWANHNISYVDAAGNVASYDLHDYVFASAGSIGVGRELMGKLGFKGYTYKFESISYVPGSDATDQSAFVDLDPATGKFAIKLGTAAISRTPIFKANLLAPSGDVIATHYIKFKIVNKIAEPIDPVVIDAGDIPYVDLYAATPAYWNRSFMPWLKMNQEVYQKLGLSHDQFRATYGWGATFTTTDADGHKMNQFDAVTNKGDFGYPLWSQNAPNVDTYAFGFRIDPKTQFGAHEWKLTFSAADPSLNPDVVILFKFNLLPPAHPEFEPAYVGNGIATTKGKLMFDAVAGREVYKMQTTLRESYKLTSIDNFQTNVIDKIVANPNGLDNAQYHEFAFGFTTAGTAILTARAEEDANTVPYNAAIDPTTDGIGSFKNQDIRLTSPLDVAQRTYGTVLRSTYVNNEVIDTKWKVRFINPLEITIDAFSLKTQELGDSKDVAKLITVKVKDVVIYNKGVSQPITGTPWATIYQVPAIVDFDWTISHNFAEVDRLTLTKNSPAAGNVTVEWNNRGTALLQNQNEVVTVKIATPYAVQTGTGNVTLLKTE